MPTLVIKSFPAELHARLKRVAEIHRRSVTQETIHLIEAALDAERGASRLGEAVRYWAAPRLIPEYRSLLESGAISCGPDSTAGLSEERDAK